MAADTRGSALLPVDAGRPFVRARLLSTVILGVVFGCSSNDAAPRLEPGANLPSTAWASDEPCTDGATRHCHESRGNDGRVLFCYDGIQTCAEHKWQACTSGVLTKRLFPSQLDTFRPKALSTPSACGAANPCDPACQYYPEVPVVPITATVGTPPVPTTVAITPQFDSLVSGFPTTTIDRGRTMPCVSGLNCQFNTRCEAPITDHLACDHSKCVTGRALTSACRTADSCVDQICASQPSCCTTTGAWDAACVAAVKSVCGAYCPSVPPAPTCAHHVCDVGAPLDSNCHPCVTKVCDPALGDPSCCTTGWTAACATKAEALCTGLHVDTSALALDGDLCHFSLYSKTSLYLGQDAQINGNIGAQGDIQITANAVLTGAATTSGNLTLDDGEIIGFVQVGGTFVAQNDWKFVGSGFQYTSSGNQAVQARTKLDIRSNPTGRMSGNMISPLLSCIGCAGAWPSWLTSSQTFTATVGTPTFTTPTQDIPTQTLTCSSTTASGTVNSATSLTLLPGDYGDVHLSGNATLILDGEGTYTFKSLALDAYSNVEFRGLVATGFSVRTCGALNIGNRINFTFPGTTYTAADVPFHLLRWYYAGIGTALIDQQDGRWFPGLVTEPLGTVQVQPNTNFNGMIHGNSVRMEPGQSVVPNNWETAACGPTCDPNFDMRTVPEDGLCQPWLTSDPPSCPSIDLAIGTTYCDASSRQVLEVCNHGGTDAPAGTALRFFDQSLPATTFASSAATVPSTTPPTVATCSTPAPVAAQSCAQFPLTDLCPPAAVSSMTTPMYVVANPGGSTTECSVLDNWSAYDKALACSLPTCYSADAPTLGASCMQSLPTANQLDETSTVVFTGDPASPRQLVAGNSAADCASGADWYFDSPSQPKEVHYCPAACAKINAGALAVHVRGNCRGAPLETPITSQIYTGTCPAHTQPMWTYLNWDTTLPANSMARVHFEVRGARSEAELPSANFVEVGIAQRDPDPALDTETCTMLSGRPNCPVALEPAFGTNAVIELRATLDPDGYSSPVLNNWTVYYTCVYND